MLKLLRAAFCLLVPALGACSSSLPQQPLSPSARLLAHEATSVGEIRYEEDFLDARLIYQGLVPNTPERLALRRQLVTFLLGAVERLDPAALRRSVSATDDMDRALGSLRDAMDLYEPQDLATVTKGMPVDEMRLLVAAARQVLALFGPQGTEAPVATALLALQTLQPTNPDWPARLEELFAWADRGAQPVPGPRNPPGPVAILENIAAIWPAPPVLDRLARAYVERQDRLATLLRRPLGGDASVGAAGDLIAQGEAVQTTAASLACLFLRGGRIDLAAARLKNVAGRPGDDADLRQLVDQAAVKKPSRDALVKLARRFLPRIEAFGGTSTDRLDPTASYRVLEIALSRFPQDAELLILASRTARALPAPFLALRYLEEAVPLREKAGAPADELADLSTELMELSFVRLRRFIDPEHMEPATREADTLRTQFGQLRKRFGGERFKLRDEEIDLTLARGLVDAGQPDRAQILFQRLSQSGLGDAEAALQLGNLAQKRGDPQRAVALVKAALDRHQAAAPQQKTIPYVEQEAKLAKALGQAYDSLGASAEARTAWIIAVSGWEILTAEHLRRRNVNESAEATVEVARLYYLLGRRDAAIQKFVEGFEQNEGRVASYIEAISFLVQRGDIDAALDLYRRALSKPAATVPEEHKLYTSLWILDITRRAGRGPDPTAEAYLRGLDSRTVILRPSRAAAWYLQLGRFALGRITYAQLLKNADTVAKRAEVYFYQAMRTLGDGGTDDAQILWRKVLESNMVSFFEFDMASRYIRLGAPTQTRPATAGEETI